MATSVTSTIETIGKIYGETKQAIDQGQGYYNQAKEYAGALKPYGDKLKPYLIKLAPYWNKISNHNEPKRVAIIIGSAIVGLYILRWFWRRRDKDELKRY